MYIVCDIGGTKTRVARATAQGLDTEPIIFPTEQSFEAESALLEKHIATLKKNDQIQGMIVGVPGSLTKDKQAIHRAPHVPDWNGKPIRHELEKTFQTPVFLESDASLVGLGEAVYGAGRGYDIVAYITVSTGVGGARIVHQDIDIATYGFEPGHQVIAISGHEEKCPSCPIPGHLEALIGGEALHSRHEEGRLRDVLTLQEKETIAEYLAVGLYNMVLFWSPGVIVLGGGLTAYDVIDVSKVREHVARINGIIPEIPTIIKGELRDIGGLYGGISYIKKRLT